MDCLINDREPAQMLLEFREELTCIKTGIRECFCSCKPNSDQSACSPCWRLRCSLLAAAALAESCAIRSSRTLETSPPLLRIQKLRHQGRPHELDRPLGQGIDLVANELARRRMIICRPRAVVRECPVYGCEFTDSDFRFESKA